MLNLPALLTGATGMDQYGFFTFEPLASRPWPLALSLALSTALAGAGYAAYRLLRLKRNWFAGNRYEAYQRSAVLFGVPVAVAFLPSFFLTGYGNKPLVLGVAGIMAASLCLTAALSDPKTRLDAGMARTLFVVGVAMMLFLVALAVSGMLVMYFVEHSPSSGNFFWSWEFAWSDLGYPAEEFSQRYRNGLLAFGIAGTLYMTVALGGSMLGAALRWAKPGGERETGMEQSAAQDSAAFVAVQNGEEAVISRSRYEDMLANKEYLLTDTILLVDKASGTAFANANGQWKRIPFRGQRRGPFQLLCIYARYPGRRFTPGELTVLLEAEMEDRDGFNISDITAQLLKRAPLIPVFRDDDGSYIPETVNVCFLDQFPAFQSENGAAPYTAEYPDPPNGLDKPEESSPQS